MDDRQLLARFAIESSDELFAQLTRRYASMVYAAARRQVRDEHLAEDVTQAVFLLLSQKARTIKSPLAGWLLTTTRLTALNAMKIEHRRSRHERGAAKMRSEQTPVDKEASWDEYVSVLDSAMEKLSRTERDCIAMRFLRGLSLGEIALSLKITQAAAQKRVNRSLIKLRRNMITSAAVPTIAVLGEQLAANGSMVPPMPLTAKLAISFSHASTVSALASGTLSTIKAAQVKIVVILLAAIAVIAGGTKLLVDRAEKRTAPTATQRSITLPVSANLSLPQTSQPSITSPRTFITLDADDLDAREALHQISKQAGVKTTLSPKGRWSRDAGHVYHVTLHLHRATFWSAMAELCGQTLTIPRETQDPYTIQIGDAGAQSNHQLGGVMMVSGPFTIVATEMFRNRSVTFADTQASKSDSIQLNIYIDPATHLLRFGTPVLTIARDDQGRSLVSTIAQGSSDQIDGGMPWTTINCKWLQRQSCAMQINNPIGHRISILRGFFKADIELASIDLVIPNLSNAVGQSLSRAGRTVSVSSARFSESVGSVDFKILIDPAATLDEDELLREGMNNFSFIDASGLALTAEMTGSAAGGHATFHADITATQPIKSPIILKWRSITRSQTVDVPFEFHDLPLPPN